MLRLVVEQSSSVHNAFIFHFHYQWEVLHTFLTYTGGCLNIYSGVETRSGSPMEDDNIPESDMDKTKIWGYIVCVCEIFPEA